VPQEAIRLIAMDDRRVFFEARSFENQERAAMCFDLQAGKLIWKTPVPQWAPIRIVADHDQGLTRRPTGGNLASNASVDLDAADGKIRFAQDRPSPLSRFDWYLPPRTAALAIRWVDTDLVGWFSTGDRSTLLRVDPHTGQRSWQVAVPYPHPSIRWLPELGDAPRFAVFLGSDDDVQIVNLASGESTVAPRTKLGFPPALATPSSIVPVTDELLNPTPRADFATERLVILGLSALVIAGLLIARFRQSSSQNRQHPF